MTWVLAAVEAQVAKVTLLTVETMGFRKLDSKKIKSKKMK